MDNSTNHPSWLQLYPSKETRKTHTDTEQRSHKLQCLCVFEPVEMNKAHLSIMFPPPQPLRTDTLICHDSTRSAKNEVKDFELFCSHTGDY